MTSVPSEDIFKCLCCLTAFKGVLDAPPDSEIVSPRPDLKEKYGDLEEGISNANSWISRALVRGGQGDVAAVAWVQSVPQNGEFRLLFSNNTRSGRDSLVEDEKQGEKLLDMLEDMFKVQQGLLNDELALRNLRIRQTQDLTAFLSNNAADLVARKMVALTRLDHYHVEDPLKNREDLKTFFTTITRDEDVLSELFPSSDRLELSEGEEWLATYVGYAVPQDPKERRAKLMQRVFHYISELSRSKREAISKDVTELRKFLRFCQEVHLSPFMREARGTATQVLEEREQNMLKKLRRRLNRLISYQSGAQAIVTDLFEYFRRVSDGKETIKLTLDMVAKSFPDKKRKDGQFTEEPSQYLDSAGLTLGLSKQEPEQDELKQRLLARLDLINRDSGAWEMNRRVNVSYHAELRLILYAVYVGWDLDIIGVSKLPCHSCFLFLQRLAKLLQAEGKQVCWRFSGCSWKPHHKWGMPNSRLTLENSDVKRAPKDRRFELTSAIIKKIVEENYATQFALLKTITATYTDDDYPLSGTDSSRKGSDRSSLDSIRET